MSSWRTCQANAQFALCAQPTSSGNFIWYADVASIQATKLN